jgi:prolyl 4-hydroxylase
MIIKLKPQFAENWVLLPVVAANDCFEIGRLAYQDEDFYHTALWMQVSLEKEEDEKNKTVPRTLVLDYLSYAAMMVGFGL